MKSIVIDASVSLAWLFDEQDSAIIKPLLFQFISVVPWLWRLEVVNSILVRERRKLQSGDQTREQLAFVDRMPVEIYPEPSERSAIALAAFARPHQLSTYDAVYLELAMRLGLPLFTRDRNLVTAARRMGVKLVAER